MTAALSATMLPPSREADDGPLARQDRFRRLRLRTQVRLRWLALLGQLVSVLLVAVGFGYPFPVAPALLVISCGALLNLFFELRRSQSMRLTPRLATTLLLFDIIQLGALLFLTGGAENPFAMLLVCPVVISASTLTGRLTVLLAGAAIAVITVLTFVSYPLPWEPGHLLVLPDLLVYGNWIAIGVTLAFTSIYTWRVAEEGRQLGNALAATELALEREQHLSALDGLAAATAHELGTPLATIALVSKEMQHGVPTDSPLREDVDLIREQAQRCREILGRLTSLSSQDAQLDRQPLTTLVDEVVAPHREFEVDIEVIKRGEGPEPVARRNSGVMHGLGNLVENAVDFARQRVVVTLRWNADEVAIEIADDGPGFPIELMDRIGEPYISRRGEGGETAARQGGGLGLGVFIAKTLLERSGATMTVEDVSFAGKGSTIVVEWPRERFEATTA